MNYTIVYGKNAGQTELFACAELQKYLMLTAGEKLPAVRENAPVAPGTKIYLGNTEAGRKFTDKIKDIVNDGFCIFPKQGNLYIYANTPRGTLYGVYRYLYEGYGIKFTDITSEDIPLNNCIKTDINVTVIPPFKYSASLTDVTYHTHDGLYSEVMPAYYAKTCSTHEFIYLNAHTDSGKTDRFFRQVEQAGGGIPLDVSINPTHNNLWYVDPTVYYTDGNKDKNRHMFCFGSSRIYDPEGPVSDINYADGINKDGSIDFTSVNAAAVYAEKLKEHILSVPDKVYFTCGQQDITYCHPDCGDTGEKTSYTVLRFYNAIAKEIKRWSHEQNIRRDIKLVIFSYYFTKSAPVIRSGGRYIPQDESVVLCDNVVIRFADIVSNQCYSFAEEQNAPYGYGPVYFEKWAPLIKNCKIWYWGYTTNHTFYYFYQPSLQKTVKTLKELRRVGAEYVMLQGNTTEDKDWKTVMENYVLGRMLTEPERDPFALRREFIESYYSVAAKEVCEIAEKLDKTVTDLNAKLVWDGNPCGYWAQIYRLYPNTHIAGDPVTMLNDKDYLMARACESVLALTDKAIKKVYDSDLCANEKIKISDRVKLIRLTPLFTLCFYRDYLYGKQEFQTGYYRDNKTAHEKVKREFFELCSHYGIKEYGEHLKIFGNGINTAESMFA